MHRCYLLLFVVGFLSGNLGAQPFDPETVSTDSLLGWLVPHLQDVTEQVDIFSLCHLALRRARGGEDDHLTGEAYQNLAEWHNTHYYVFPEHNDSSVYYDRAAFEAYRAAGRDSLAAVMQYFLALDYGNLNRNDSALAAAYRALPLFERLDDRKMVVLVMEQLAQISANLQDTLRTQRHLAALENMITQLSDKELHIPVTWLRMGSDAETIGDFAAARRYVDRGLAGIRAQPPATRDQDTEIPLAYSLSARLYAQAGDYDRALADGLAGLRMVQDIAGDTLAGEIYADLGLIYLDRREYDQAVGALEKARDYEQKFNPPVTSRTQTALAEAYYRSGRYRQAADLRELLLTTNKADFQRIRNSINSELAEKYETDKKDRTIAFQQDLLAQQQRTQWLTGGIVVLLLLGLLGLFVGLRNNRRKNGLLEKRNGENELLLREIHHRVKNNLGVVSSLLRLQSAKLTDAGAKEAMRASQSRVKSMALLHQKLYQHDNLSGIEMQEYLINLTRDLLSSHGESDRLTVSVEMDPLVLDVDQAVPVGLIVNELMTNALKYAYPPGFLAERLAEEEGAAAGAIEVGLSMAGENYTLTVSDCGVGKAVGAAPDGTGFGSQLVDLLTRQLGGTLSETSHGGLTVELRFPAPERPGAAFRR